jgi:DNA polymerase-3 subunit gamma/tau
MSYLVLARRYRPQTFKEVVGQTHVVKTLANALKQGKLTHALLFAGIKGTGKTTIARIIAKALNCQNLIDGYEPCNQCTNCIEINKGIFVDVIEIDAASNRGIDQIREIIENLKFAPAKGKAKVYIIDEAHMLTKEASNALLKSLEEPPSHVYFILATTEPNKLLPTILSRCQRYDFRRLDLSLLVKHLKNICQKEGYEIEEEALKLIAKEAQGSLRDALSLLDQAMAYGTKTKEDVILAFGWHEAILVEELAQVLLEKDLPKVLSLAQKIYEQGIDLVYLMEKLTEFFRELLVMKAFPKETQYNFQNPVLRDLLLEYELEDILLIFQSLVKDLEVLRRSNYPQLQFEISLVKICEYQKLVPLKKIIEKLDQISVANFTFNQEGEKTSISSNEEKVKTQEEPQVSSVKPQVVSKPKTWSDLVEKIQQESPALFGLISSVPEPQIASDKIILKIKASLKESPYFNVLKEKIESYFQKPLELQVENDKKSSLEEVKERPEVKTILKTFSAKIAYIQPLLKE